MRTDRTVIYSGRACTSPSLILRACAVAALTAGRRVINRQEGRGWVPS